MKTSYYTNIDKTLIHIEFIPDTPHEMKILEYLDQCIFKKHADNMFWQEKPIIQLTVRLKNES